MDLRDNIISYAVKTYSVRKRAVNDCYCSIYSLSEVSRNREVTREKKTTGEYSPKAGGQLLQTRQGIGKLNSPSGEGDESGNTS